MNGDWEGTGYNTSASAVSQLMNLVRKYTAIGDDYNMNYFYSILEPMIKYLGSSWLEENGFSEAWGELATIVDLAKDTSSADRADNLTILSEGMNLLAANNSENHKYDFLSSSPLASLMYS